MASDLQFKWHKNEELIVIAGQVSLEGNMAKPAMADSGFKSKDGVPQMVKAYLDKKVKLSLSPTT